MAKGDLRGVVRCPVPLKDGTLCGKKIRGWKITTGPGGYQATTRAGIRHALRSHLYTYHPWLSSRQRTVLMDFALSLT